MDKFHTSTTPIESDATNVGAILTTLGQTRIGNGIVSFILTLLFLLSLIGALSGILDIASPNPIAIVSVAGLLTFARPVLTEIARNLYLVAGAFEGRLEEMTGADLNRDGRIGNNLNAPIVQTKIQLVPVNRPLDVFNVPMPGGGEVEVAKSDVRTVVEAETLIRSDWLGEGDAGAIKPPFDQQENAREYYDAIIQLLRHAALVKSGANRATVLRYSVGETLQKLGMRPSE